MLRPWNSKTIICMFTLCFAESNFQIFTFNDQPIIRQNTARQPTVMTFMSADSPQSESNFNCKSCNFRSIQGYRQIQWNRDVSSVVLVMFLTPLSTNRSFIITFLQPQHNAEVNSHFHISVFELVIKIWLAELAWHRSSSDEHEFKYSQLRY